MLKPKFKQLPDYSEYLGKEFIIICNADMSKTGLSRPMLKGVRFIIKEIKNNNVIIKILNKKKN